MKTNSYFTKLFIILFITVMLFPFKGFTQRINTLDKNTSEFVPGTIVIKVKEGIGPFEKQETGIYFGVPSLDETAVKYKVTKLEKRFKHKPIAKNSGLPDLSRIYRIEFPESQNVHQVAKEFADNPNIEYAEPMPIGKFTETPDDPSYGIQQHLPQIMAPEAWDVHKGEDGEEVIVAIIDTGADWLHPDLTENCWQNLGEDADGDGVTLEFNDGVWERDPDDLNGIDDDNNGYIDDVIGWDFHEQISIGDGSNPDPLWNQGPYDHGTHCAGIAAGRTNNGIGISSVSWNIKYMPVQVDNGYGSVSYGIDGVIYAAENGADIISNSWYYRYAYSQSDNDAMQYAIGLGSIVCFAAANDNSSDVAFPAGYQGVISIAAVNPDDTRASFSNYGISVDVAAPGVSILSTIPNNSYASWGGTSMATPMVAGMFGLLKSYQPDWSNDELIEQVLGTADDIDPLNPGYENALGSGRINAYNTLVDENVEVPQELRLEVLDLTMEDENGNGLIEAGETVSVSFSMRNFAHFVGDDNAVITLSSYDPDITFISGSTNVVIPMDAVIEIEDAFEFKVSENAEVHEAILRLEVSSEKEITYGSQTEYSVIIAPSGFFIWEGDIDLPDHSGTFIRNFLEERGYPVLYSNNYLQNLNGFDAVFLSFGNWDSGSTPTTNQMADVMIDYLENGGYVYLEGGDVLGYDQADNSQFLDLFGLESAEDGSTNPINKLDGQLDALTNDMVFTGNSQINNSWIDKYVPSDNGIAAFIEDGYGTVAVQNSIPDGHRTFCFSYAMSYLNDANPHSSRYNIMIQLMDFFGYPEDEGFVVANFASDNTKGEPGLEVQFTDWSIADTDTEITGWAWDFDGDGEIDSYDQNPTWTYGEGGVFDVSLIASSESDIDTLVRQQYIIIRSGILVYEGFENENGYSGSFIRDYLEDYSYDEVGYTNTFPSTLAGYNVVFLSFGNIDYKHTTLSNTMAGLIYNFCLDGGKVYVEGGDAMYSGSNMWEAFGLGDVLDGEENMITNMMGQDGAITEGLHFNSSNQFTFSSIDTYTIINDIPAVIVAFEESDYGPVAVQFDGSDMFGQKTFCMSYALADLEDGTGSNTRNELLSRILNFFDVVSDVNKNELSIENNLKVFPNPAHNQITLQINVEKSGNIQIEVFDLSGRRISTMNQNVSKGSHNIDFNISGFNTGIYYFRLQSGTQTETIKWVKVE